MADQKFVKQTSEQFRSVILGKLVISLKAKVTELDTLTVSELSDITYAEAVGLESGLVVAVSISTNVITITESSLVDKDIYVLVAGDKA